MFRMRRCDFMALLAAWACVWPLLAAQAQQPATTGASATTSPHIEIMRVKPVERRPTELRLGEGRVDLMKDFSLSSREGVGDVWGTPAYIPSPARFDDRYGKW
jgi:hypothetical protein